MSNRSRLRKFTHKPIKDPFDNDERGQAKAFRRVFESDDGQKVLDSLIFDMDMQHPNLAQTEYQCGFNAGKQYFVHHIMAALSAEFEEVEEDD